MDTVAQISQINMKIKTAGLNKKFFSSSHCVGSTIMIEILKHLLTHVEVIGEVGMDPLSPITLPDINVWQDGESL